LGRVGRRARRRRRARGLAPAGRGGARVRRAHPETGRRGRADGTRGRPGRRRAAHAPQPPCRHRPAGRGTLVRDRPRSDRRPPRGLFAGPTALAFAAATAARRPDEYAGVLATLDERIAGWVLPRLRAEWERIDAGRAGTVFGAYDVVSGATGVGRYLLNRTVR